MNEQENNAGSTESRDLKLWIRFAILIQGQMLEIEGLEKTKKSRIPTMQGHIDAVLCG